MGFLTRVTPVAVEVFVVHPVADEYAPASVVYIPLPPKRKRLAAEEGQDVKTRKMNSSDSIGRRGGSP